MKYTFDPERTVVDLIKQILQIHHAPSKHRAAELPGSDWEERLSIDRSWISNFDIDGFLGPMLSYLEGVYVFTTCIISVCNRRSPENIQKCFAGMQADMKRFFSSDHDNDGYIVIIPENVSELCHFRLYVCHVFRSGTCELHIFDSLLDPAERDISNTIGIIRIGMGIDKGDTGEWIIRNHVCEPKQGQGQCGLYVCLYAILYALRVDEQWFIPRCLPSSARWISGVMYRHYLNVLTNRLRRK